MGAAILAGLAAALAAGTVSAPAEQAAPVERRTDSGPAAAAAWPVGKGVEVLCVLDGRGESLCLYRFAAATGRLELVAARSIKFDLQLEDLNAAAPTPAQVRERLKKEGRNLPAADAGAASKGLSVTTLKVSEEQQVLCVLDTGRGVLCVYEFDVKQRRLRLAAARMLRYDFELQELNNEGLSPAEIEKQLKRSRENKKTAEGSGG